MTDTLTPPATARESMSVVLVGHVDHGKSTLVGRLFYDTGSLPDGRYEAVARVCEDTGKPFEFAFLLDALEEERDQGITIDTAQARFRTDRRDYVLVDAPGHKEFLKNMVSGAASAEAAVLLIDAAEGVQEQSRRHGYLVHLLGIRQIIVAINKMDLVGYSRETFERVRAEYLAFLGELGLAPRNVVPVAARHGDNVAAPSKQMPWYDGPTILEALDHFQARPERRHLPLRFPVQDVYKFDHRRTIAGRVESGTLAEGDEVLFSPSGHRGVVKRIERWEARRTGPAEAGESIGITLTEQLFIERGDILSHPSHPPRVSQRLQARLFWLGNRHLAAGRPYVLKLTTQEVTCHLEGIGPVVDTATLAARAQSEVAKNEVATVTLYLNKPIAFDAFTDMVETGRFVLVDGLDVAGGGIVLEPVEGDYSI
ncbi:MAG: 50S ribosome-binding GTPase [Armatimonadetes bacterium]|nr:50S ribosome-binding GTPase [Armatimonadota bacterium]